MALPKTIEHVRDEFELIDRFDRLELLINLGRALEPMPEALKTDETLVTGCSAQVWVYPLPTSGSERLQFQADSTAAIPKGIIALILMIVQDKSAREVLETDIEKELAPLDLGKHFTSLRTSGLKNMILKIKETAGRLAA